MNNKEIIQELEDIKESVDHDRYITERLEELIDKLEFTNRVTKK